MGMGYAFGTIAKQWLALAPARAELQKLIDLAAQGDSEAAHALGIRYSTAGLGDVVRQDIATAMAYYQQAADAGHIGAHCRLGAAYRSGLAAAAVPAQHDCRAGRPAAEPLPAFLPSLPPCLLHLPIYPALPPFPSSPSPAPIRSIT